jgi:hypothetical protein
MSDKYSFAICESWNAITTIDGNMMRDLEHA